MNKRFLKLVKNQDSDEANDKKKLLDDCDGESVNEYGVNCNEHRSEKHVSEASNSHIVKTVETKISHVVKTVETTMKHDDGVEMIGLQRIRQDVETLTKQKLNGAKGGRKRAKNQAEKQINEVKPKEELSEEVKEVKPEMTHSQEEELMYQAMYYNGN